MRRHDPVDQRLTLSARKEAVVSQSSCKVVSLRDGECGLEREEVGEEEEVRV
jgi:hypothetical protein